MYESLGLARDPFQPHYDEYLHVVGKAARRRLPAALSVVSSGRSLWICGPEGSGREAFVAGLAERLADDRPVVSPSASGPDGRPRLLASLHATLCGGVPPEDPLALCEEVYARLLLGFWRGAPVLCLAKAERLGPEDREELEIISELAFLGRPVAIVVACGQGEPPFAAMERIELPRPGPEALAEFLRTRLGLCGGAGLLDAEIDRLASEAAGYSDALRLGSLALARLRYERALSAFEKPAEPDQPRLFSPDALGEVGWLLGEISSGNSD